MLQGFLTARLLTLFCSAATSPPPHLHLSVSEPPTRVSLTGVISLFMRIVRLWSLHCQKLQELLTHVRRVEFKVLHKRSAVWGCQRSLPVTEVSASLLSTQDILELLSLLCFGACSTPTVRLG